MPAHVYGSRPVKRQRRARAQLPAVDDAIEAAVVQDAPITLRGVYYRAGSAGAVDAAPTLRGIVERALTQRT